MMKRRCLATVLGVLLVSGCTHWSTRRVYGPKQEMARRLVGAPQIAQSTESNGSLGFSGVSRRDPFGSVVSNGGLSGSSGSLKRTHCLQLAEVDYQQRYDVVPTTVGRSGDLIGGILVGLVGLGYIDQASRAHDVGPYDEAPDPTDRYVLGGALAILGAAWITYSYVALPSSAKRPEVRQDADHFTVRELVEATGCGLVPGDFGAAPDDATEHLRKLEELRRSGLITDEEYRAKRQRLLDGL